MAKFIRIILVMLVVISSACATLQSSADQEVHDFLQLLIEKNEPTLSEYARFSGEGDPSELELVFELRECSSRGWGNDTKPCVDFVRNRWRSSDEQKALYLSWLRTRFSTVGNSYRIIGIKSKTEGFHHNLVEVAIGKNRFVLFHNTDPGRPTSLVVGVSEVNGKKIRDYLK
jgi:hypothetical protein